MYQLSFKLDKHPQTFSGQTCT